MTSCCSRQSRPYSPQHHEVMRTSCDEKFCFHHRDDSFPGRLSKSLGFQAAERRTTVEQISKVRQNRFQASSGSMGSPFSGPRPEGSSECMSCPGWPGGKTRIRFGRLAVGCCHVPTLPDGRKKERTQNTPKRLRGISRQNKNKGSIPRRALHSAVVRVHRVSRHGIRKVRSGHGGQSCGNIQSGQLKSFWLIWVSNTR